MEQEIIVNAIVTRSLLDPSCRCVGLYVREQIGADCISNQLASPVSELKACLATIGQLTVIAHLRSGDAFQDRRRCINERSRGWTDLFFQALYYDVEPRAMIVPL